MNDDDPRRKLDPFTAALVEQMRIEVEMTAKQLVCLQADIALAQLDILRKRALHRLKNLNFEMYVDFSRMGGLPDMPQSQLSEEDIAKVISITIAALEQTFDGVREHVVDTDEATYGSDDEADDAE